MGEAVSPAVCECPAVWFRTRDDGIRIFGSYPIPHCSRVPRQCQALHINEHRDRAKDTRGTARTAAARFYCRTANTPVVLGRHQRQYNRLRKLANRGISAKDLRRYYEDSSGPPVNWTRRALRQITGKLFECDSSTETDGYFRARQTALLLSARRAKVLPRNREAKTYLGSNGLNSDQIRGVGQLHLLLVIKCS